MLNMSDIDIDNEILISLIEERPVLWDKTLDIFKDRDATRNAWREVCIGIRSDFDVFDDKKRNDFGKEVMKRWKHLRDAFAKAEKRTRESKTSGSQANKKRKYIFNDELQFLKKIYEQSDTAESFATEKKREDETDDTSLQPLEKTEHEVSLTTGTKEKAPSNAPPRRKHKKMDEIDLKILKVLEKPEPEKLNSQMSFYHSLMEHTETFNSNEWLQFQLQVLQLIASIKKPNVAVLQCKGYTTQSSPIQQQSQSMPYHPQHTLHYSQHPHFSTYVRTSIPSGSTVDALVTPLSQPTQHRPTFTTLAVDPSKPSNHSPYDPSSIQPVSTQNALPTSRSLLTKDKMKAISTAEYVEHFAEYVDEEDCERSSSTVYSYNSSSTMDFNF